MKDLKDLLNEKLEGDTFPEAIGITTKRASEIGKTLLDSVRKEFKNSKDGKFCTDRIMNIAHDKGLSFESENEIFFAGYTLAMGINFIQNDPLTNLLQMISKSN